MTVSKENPEGSWQMASGFRSQLWKERNAVKTIANEVKNQPEGGRRRGFLKAFGIATAGAAVAAAAVAPVQAGPVLTARQRTMLAHYDQLNDAMQLQLIVMAEHYVKMFPRQGEPMRREAYLKSVGVNEGRGDEGTLGRLSQQERALIQSFRGMDDRARRTVVRLAKRNAEEWPRHEAPQLRLVAGGAA